MPPLGIAPRLSAPQAEVLLLYYSGAWRCRASIPDLNLAKVVCYHLQHTPTGVRPPGLEPESYAWKAQILPLYYGRAAKLHHGESNPGHLRDRQRCYQLHHIGSLGVSGVRSQYLVLAKHARFRLRQYPSDTWGIRTPACRAHSLSRRAP